MLDPNREGSGAPFAGDPRCTGADRLSETGNVTANGSSSIRRAKCDIAEVKHAIQLAVRDMTIRMGAIAVALLAALATIKFFA